MWLRIMEEGCRLEKSEHEHTGFGEGVGSLTSLAGREERLVKVNGRTHPSGGNSESADVKGSCQFDPVHDSWSLRRQVRLFFPFLLLTGPCLLPAQPDNSCYRLESHLYCQVLLAKCIPCVPLTFTTAGKCLVINQNRRDEWSSLAASCSHYHPEEMNVPSMSSVSQLEAVLFSWEC